MLAVRDNVAQGWSALQAHKLRTLLTMLGLTMGVATLITVMTLVQGANVYVEQKIANLGVYGNRMQGECYPSVKS